MRARSVERLTPKRAGLPSARPALASGALADEGGTSVAIGWRALSAGTTDTREGEQSGSERGRRRHKSMRYSNRVLFSAMTLVTLVGCSSDADVEGAGVGSNSENLTAASQVLGFESSGAWSVASGTAKLQLSTDRVQGARSLEVSGIAANHVKIESDLTQAPSPVDSTVVLRIKPPLGHAQASWKGLVQLSVHSPSRGLDSALIGRVSLDALSEGTFGSVAFAVPESVRSALGAGSVSDVRYALTLMVPLSGPYLLDSLRLSPEISMPAPTPKAYAGGRDIALVWDEMQWSLPTVRYMVFRDNKLLTPENPNIDFRNTYVDQDVVAGRTYTYRIVAVTSNSLASAWSAPVVVELPTDAVPVPTVTINSDEIPNDSNRARKVEGLEAGKRFLEVWYPKVAQLIAKPARTPYTSIVLRGAPKEYDAASNSWRCFASGWHSGGNVVNICEDDTWDMGLYVHESTHAIQEGQSQHMPGLGEGVASWAGNLSIGKPNKKPTPVMTYYDDYEYAAYFYDWIATTYNKPKFVRDINQASFLGEFDARWLPLYTGYTVAQLYREMTGTFLTSNGPLRNATGRYALPVAPPNSDLVVGSSIQIFESTEYHNDRFFLGPMHEGRGLLRWQKTCVGEDAQYFVVIQDCSDVANRRWRYDSGRFISSKSDRCLQALGGSNTDGTVLVTAPCNQSAAQQWDPLPL
jgi:hypothetical protein